MNELSRFDKISLRIYGEGCNLRVLWIHRKTFGFHLTNLEALYNAIEKNHSDSLICLSGCALDPNPDPYQDSEVQEALVRFKRRTKMVRAVI